LRALCCGFLATLAVLASAPFAHAAAWPTTQWRTVFRARTTELSAVAASGPRSAWAAGFNSDPSYVMHWNGRAWRRMPLLPAHFQVTDVAATSWSDVWVEGESGFLLHWDGTSWQRLQFHRGLTTWPWEFAVVGDQLWQAANGVVAGHHRLVIRQWTGPAGRRCRHRTRRFLPAPRS
jgi:hypothetical protein